MHPEIKNLLLGIGGYEVISCLIAIRLYYMNPPHQRDKRLFPFYILGGNLLIPACGIAIVTIPIWAPFLFIGMICSPRNRY